MLAGVPDVHPIAPVDALGKMVPAIEGRRATEADQGASLLRGSGRPVRIAVPPTRPTSGILLPRREIGRAPIRALKRSGVGGIWSDRGMGQGGRGGAGRRRLFESPYDPPLTLRQASAEDRARLSKRGNWVGKRANSFALRALPLDLALRGAYTWGLSAKAAPADRKPLFDK